MLILSESQTKKTCGGVIKALLAGSTTQYQNARPCFRVNVVDINEAQVTTVPAAERVYWAAEALTNACSTQSRAHQVCKTSPLPGQVTRPSEASVLNHAQSICPLSVTADGRLDDPSVDNSGAPLSLLS